LNFVEFYFGSFLVNSKCLNYTLLLSFFRSTYMAIFTFLKGFRTGLFIAFLHIMKYLKLLPVLLFLWSPLSGQNAEQIRLKDLQKVLTTSTDRIQVFNFWATWCAPCVKEIPLFEKLNQENNSVDVTLVSMDFDLDPNPDKVNRFVVRKNIQSKVVILTETDPNSWIDKIDKEWTGVLPATLIINTKSGKRKLVQKELHEGDLEKLIEEVKH
jgi:thiol-disulfide isomerase/thioredoxin